MDMTWEHINLIGKAFLEFSLPILIQSSVLITFLLLVELLLQKKVRAVLRYWLGILVFVQLILLPIQSSRVFLEYLNLLRTPEGAQFVAHNLTWQGAVFLVWLVVVMIMGFVLLKQAVFASKLIKQASEANSLMKDILVYCCNCMGVRRKVRLKVSARVTGPVVCGLLNPVILVPDNLTPSLGSRHLRAILLHELAHIKRGDLWVNLAQTILQIIYFYHPLLWLANPMIQRIREQAVNETVLDVMGRKAQYYPQQLLDIAKAVLRSPALSLGFMGLVESKSTLDIAHS